MSTLNRLGDKVSLAAELLETAISGERRRPLTVGEFLDGRVETSLRAAPMHSLLAEAEAVLAKDDAAMYFGSSGGLVMFADVVARLRNALEAAKPFEAEVEGPKPQETPKA